MCYTNSWNWNGTAGYRASLASQAFRIEIVQNQPTQLDAQTIFQFADTIFNTHFNIKHRLYSFKHRLCLFAFIDRALLLTQKLLNQGYIASKLQSSLLSFNVFYGRHHDLVDRYDKTVSPNEDRPVPLISFPHTRFDMSNMADDVLFRST